MKKLKNALLVLAAVIGIGLMIPSGAYAASVITEQCDGVTDSKICNDQNADPNALAKTIVNVLMFIVGSISVVMLIVGGIFYATSAGDSGRVTMAKNTVTYAIVGLVVSVLAYAIVRFVFDQFGK